GHAPGSPAPVRPPARAQATPLVAWGSTARLWVLGGKPAARAPRLSRRAAGPPRAPLPARAAPGPIGKGGHRAGSAPRQWPAGRAEEGVPWRGGGEVS